MSEIRTNVWGKVTDFLMEQQREGEASVFDYNATCDRADKILSIPELAQGLEAVEKGYNAKVDRGAKLTDCPYCSLVFPTTIEEAGKFLTDKGLADREKTAISGTIARLGWDNCIIAMLEAGYVKEV